MANPTISFLNTSTNHSSKFVLSDPFEFFGRTNLNLNSDKISRKCFKISKELEVSGYKLYFEGLLDPTKPAILIKYQNDLTWKDSLTVGMKIAATDIDRIKFVNVNNSEVCFVVETGVEKVAKPVDSANNSAEEPNQRNSPSSTPQQPLNHEREGCRYMNNCYRNNPQHKRDFSHPTDSDWKQGECPYGTRCYRKNPVHKQRYTHTKRQAAIQAIDRVADLNHQNSDASEMESEGIELEDSEEDSEYVDSQEMED